MAACDEPRWCGENPGTPTPRPRYPRPGTASRSSYIGRFVRPLGVDARCRALQGRDGPAASPATHRRVGGVAGPRRWGAPSASSAARLESRNREPHATPVAEARRHTSGAADTRRCKCCGVGWGGRIRTFDLLIQSQAPYRLATPQREWLGDSTKGPLPRSRWRLIRLAGTRMALSASRQPQP
jgi:hypothetical protein